MIYDKIDIEADEQLVLLKRQLQYVNEYAEFYRNHFALHRISIDQIRSLEDLRKIPTVSKQDLQRHHKAFWCAKPSQIVDYTNTSGTEGKPVTIPLTEADIQRLAENERLSLSITGGDKDEIYQLTTTTDRRFMAGLAYVLGARALGAGMVRVGPGLPELQWQTITELGTTALIIVPSFLVKLIEYAKAHNLDYQTSTVKKAICIGEPIRNNDFTLNALGKRIHEQWDIELYSTYASSEMATAFTECKAGRGGHILPGLIHAEVLDEEGNTLPDGVPGELVITQLGVEGFPLVRFRTGDICAMFSAPCSCGRNTPRLGPVVGRKHQMIKQKGTTCYPPAIFDVLDHIQSIGQYQVELTTDELGNDRVLIRYSLVDELPVKVLSDHLKAGIRFVPDLQQLSEQDMLKRVIDPAHRKPVKLIDKRIANTF